MGFGSHRKRRGTKRAVTKSSISSPPQPPRVFSQWSSAEIPDGGWASCDFMMGSGMVIIQPSSHKVVVCYDSLRQEYFLPKGRKDVGESLEEAAVREAYEESGYEAQHFPLYKVTRAPAPPKDPGARESPHTEAVYVSVRSWGPKKHDEGGEYFTFWYVGKIGPDAKWTPGTGMPDEQHYSSELYEYGDALRLLRGGTQQRVLEYTWDLYLGHLEMKEEIRKRRRKAYMDLNSKYWGKDHVDERLKGNDEVPSHRSVSLTRLALRRE
ncbi:uncharacterized protein BT62DRAFT_1009426 [Guyanagaster necrorhizus]|uniref:Nudix hydrolase domain-containing protein n=1 Tax=Guyanagaster necrorhizus TaxID=856835 RepID=A0A9P8APR7_9AGAR|nr:uncharacterized protein BT62DRAFT_1009426 [Guyanagaster necrorhizus MCA 3950]KAG7443240.1 hypothetical protein BT62DRAFT_1009426 [Guyanagaster necrorhizus MCA 3950]